MKLKLLIAALLALAVVNHGASAQAPVIPGAEYSGPTGNSFVPFSGPVTISPATVGTSAANIAAAAKVGNWTYVYLGNPNTPGGPNVWCAFGGTTAVAQAAGTIEVSSGQVITFEGTVTPQGPISCISDTASTAFTYGVK